MRRLLLPAAMLCIVFASCKKNDLTPDGKPKSDASKSIVRIDASAAASYWLSVAAYDADKVGSGTENASFYLLKNDLNTPYEAVFTANADQIVFIEVDSEGGPTVSCDVFFKGVKASPPKDLFNSNNPTGPSHVTISYVVGQ